MPVHLRVVLQRSPLLPLPQRLPPLLLQRLLLLLLLLLLPPPPSRPPPLPRLPRQLPPLLP